MGKVVVSEYVSLDQVMEEPAWTMPYWNAELATIQRDLLFASDALLLGRVTYQGFIQAWPDATDEDGFAERMNALPKFVATTTLETAEWNAHLIRDNVVEEVTKLKQQSEQNLLIYGSASLVNTLMHHNLIDEYHLLVHPVVVGGGKHLFTTNNHQTALKLVSARTTSTGVVILSYGSA